MRFKTKNKSKWRQLRFCCLQSSVTWRVCLNFTGPQFLIFKMGRVGVPVWDLIVVVAGTEWVNLYRDSVECLACKKCLEKHLWYYPVGTAKAITVGGKRNKEAGERKEQLIKLIKETQLIKEKKLSALLFSGPECMELGSDLSTITINKKLNKLKINNSS